jgi:hypothetical protein
MSWWSAREAADWRRRAPRLSAARKSSCSKNRCSPAARPASPSDHSPRRERDYFTTTEGGAAVNQRLQVLDRQGRPIPGLYAVGQNGLGGMVLWGHGLHIAWAMTSGRLAGCFVMETTRE